MTTLNFNETFNDQHAAWVFWPEGNFDVKLKYLSVEGAERIFKESNIPTWDSKTHQKIDRLDEERFTAKIADLIMDWKNVTPERTKHLVPYKAGTPMDGTFPCDQAHKLAFLRRFKGFLAWILDTARELHKFDEKEQEESLKN